MVANMLKHGSIAGECMEKQDRFVTISNVLVFSSFHKSLNLMLSISFFYICFSTSVSGSDDMSIFEIVR
jgi:hypothetical protein